MQAAVITEILDPRLDIRYDRFPICPQYLSKPPHFVLTENLQLYLLVLRSIIL